MIELQCAEWKLILIIISLGSFTSNIAAAYSDAFMRNPWFWNGQAVRDPNRHHMEMTIQSLTIAVADRAEGRFSRLLNLL